MKINGAKIFNEGVFVDSDCKEKIREIVDAVNGISESPVKLSVIVLAK